MDELNGNGRMRCNSYTSTTTSRRDALRRPRVGDASSVQSQSGHPLSQFLASERICYTLDITDISSIWCVSLREQARLLQILQDVQSGDDDLVIAVVTISAALESRYGARLR